MAAICGLFYKNHSKSQNEQNINKMLESISKFDDDVVNWATLEHIALGQILSEKTQNFSDSRDLAPFRANNQTLIIQYARIDNKNELCQKVDADTSISIQELIFMLYKKYSINFAKEILGDFAIAIWDENKLICATDIMNCRPIFYFNNETLFAFSTEIRALHALPEIKKEPNLVRIANQALFDTFHIDQEFNSYFNNIHYLPGATVLVVDKNQFSKRPYWQIDITKELKLKNEDEYVEVFNEIFKNAIKCRTNVSSPIGVMLSGGLDSSAITAMTCKIFKEENRTLEAFCNVLPLDYTGTNQDERKFIELLQTDNLNINYMSHALEGPFADLFNLINTVESPNYISQQYIHKAIGELLVKKNVRVLLDGVYGEIGPTHPDNHYFTRQFLQLNWINLLKESYSLAKQQDKPWAKLLFKRTIAPLIPNIIRELLLSSTRERTQNVGLPLQDDFIKKYSSLPSDYKKLRLKNHNHILNRKKNQQYGIIYKQQMHPLNCYMEKSGVELLHPYLDRRILEFCISIPDNMYVKNGYLRYLIRRTMQGIMPDKICTRTTKAAFVPDYMERYQQDLGEVKKIFREIEKSPLASEIINLEKLSKMLETSTTPGSFMGGQNIEAFMIIPTTLALGVFLSTFYDKI